MARVKQYAVVEKTWTSGPDGILEITLGLSKKEVRSYYVTMRNLPRFPCDLEVLEVRPVSYARRSAGKCVLTKDGAHLA